MRAASLAACLLIGLAAFLALSGRAGRQDLRQRAGPAADLDHRAGRDAGEVQEAWRERARVAPDEPIVCLSRHREGHGAIPIGPRGGVKGGRTGGRM